MMIQINVPDGSPELEELQYVVATINSTNARDAAAEGHPAPTPITIQEYVTPIVMGHFKKRVQQVYIEHARSQPTAKLKEAFGDLDTLRKSKKK